MASSQGPTSADITRLTTAVKDMNQSLKKMNDGLRALNTNLVAIHELLKENKIDE